MTKPVVVQIPHRLGREEAVRRLQAGLGQARTSFGGQFVVVEENWSQEHLDFRATVLGQTTGGMIDVADDHVRIDRPGHLKGKGETYIRTLYRYHQR
jgi:Putative polyhydroxyalkanoic acid system protein (PHA_gran_rgn)